MKGVEVIMIKEPTVLILGAGASVEYDFPLGRNLLLKICENASNKESTLFNSLIEFGFDKNEINKFSQSLLYSMQPSIDAFLEHRTEYIEIGKAAIACTLIPCEVPGNVGRKEKLGWYEYLFSYLNSSKKDFINNNLSIITFNYDRSLEYFLLRSIEHSFNSKEPESIELLSNIPIIYVHGSLGELANNSANHRKYEPTLDMGLLKKCIDSIHIIYEELQENEQLEKAHEELKRAEKVCFLGFGYHQTNIDRLKILEMEHLKTLHGSAHSIERAEQLALQRRMKGRIKLGYSSQGCLDYLKDHFVFE